MSFIKWGSYAEYHALRIVHHHLDIFPWLCCTIPVKKKMNTLIITITLKISCHILRLSQIIGKCNIQLTFLISWFLLVLFTGIQCFPVHDENKSYLFYLQYANYSSITSNTYCVLIQPWETSTSGQWTSPSAECIKIQCCDRYFKRTQDNFV